MPTMADVRSWALSLPESSELAHDELGSFRVRGKIFATVPDEQCVRIMVEEHEILAAAASHPDACQPEGVALNATVPAAVIGLGDLGVGEAAL